MSLEVFSLLQPFWKHLRKIVINSLNVWWSSPVELSFPDCFFFFVGRFVITDSISLLVYQVFCFSLIMFWQIVFLGIYSFLEVKCPIVQVVQFLATQLFIIFSYNPVCFCGIGCNILSFISDFSYFSLFLLVNLGKHLSVLLIFKKLNHSSVDFFCSLSYSLFLLSLL